MCIRLFHRMAFQEWKTIAKMQFSEKCLRYVSQTTLTSTLQKKTTTVKANALFEYIKNTNARRGFAEPKVVGGIVIKTGSQFYLYQSDNYHDYNSNHDGWINFNELIRDIDENDIEKILKRLVNNLK